MSINQYTIVFKADIATTAGLKAVQEMEHFFSGLTLLEALRQTLQEHYPNSCVANAKTEIISMESP